VTDLIPTRGRVAFAAACVALAAALVAGQMGTDAFAPAGQARDTGRTLGRTGDAYLSGLRIFAALVIWNKLEPQFDGYYGSLALSGQRFLLPNLRLVLFLDPQFVQAYYDVPWILADNGRVDEALDVARQGIADNPKSGLLRMAYAQYLFVFKKDVRSAAVQADRALAPGMQWRDELEFWENARIAEDIYNAAGQTGKADRMRAVLDQLAAKYGGAKQIPGERSTGNHDHNLDGKQDH
jgi:tetratricopeptide (TPR) repeat protein